MTSGKMFFIILVGLISFCVFGGGVSAFQVTISSPQNTTITDTTPDLVLTTDELANITYNWDGEGDISGCILCTSYGTTYGESVPDVDTSLIMHFNENTGSIAIDDSPNHNDGTIAGAVWTSGRFGSALSFDGVDDTVNAGNAADILPAGSPFTISYWVNPSSHADLNRMIGTEASGRGFEFEFYNNLLRFYVGTSGNLGDQGIAVASASEVPIGVWNHIAGTWDSTSGELKLYINGVEKGNDIYPNWYYWAGHTHCLWIGSDEYSDCTPQHYFNGMIDEVAIFDRALSAAEIQNLHSRALSYGSHSVIGNAKDTVGNIDSSEVYFTISIETTPPSITIDSPQNTTYTTASIDLNVSADELIDTWTYSLNGANNVTFGSSGPEKQLTTSSGNDYHAVWSPDGSKIAFLSNRSGGRELWVMNADGSGQTQLTNLGIVGTMAWSPDGTEIAFNHRRTAEADIYTISGDGSNLTLLTSTDSQYEEVRGYSPDGTKILYDKGSNGWFEVWIMNSDGSGQQSLATEHGQDTYSQWSPDGSKISYVYASDYNQPLSLALMNPDGSAKTTVASFPMTYGFYYGWSPDSSEIAFGASASSSQQSVREVYIINANGTGLTKLADGDIYWERHPGQSEVWSPDGNWIVYNSNDSGNWDISIMHPDGSEKTQLTTDPSTDKSAHFSPDGKKILFVSDRSENNDIWVLELGGTGSNTALEVLSDGVHRLTVYANDTAGNMGSSEVYFTISLDTTPPSITIDSPQNITYTTASIDLNVSADEPIDIWTYSLNGGSNVTFTPNTTIFGGENWWDSPWQFKQTIDINNNAAAILSEGYTVGITLDHVSLVSSGKSLADGSDVRVVYQPNASYSLELDRINSTAFNSASTEILFKLQEDVPAGGSDSNYYLYYGNPSPGTPPENAGNVYVFYDDFSDGDMGDWTTSGGSWTAADGYMKTTTNDVRTEKSIGTYDNFELSHRFYVSGGLVTYMLNSLDKGYIQYMAPVDPATAYHFRRDVYGGTPYPYGTLLQLPYTTAPVNSWNDYKITRFNNEWKVYFNGDLKGSVNDSYATSFSKIKLAAGWSNSDGRWDDFKLRRFIDPEPTLSLSGEEIELTDGSHNVIVYAVDTAGNIGSSGVYFTIETAPPITDSDSDGIPDDQDNCPAIANSDQLDTDGDGLGNVCDPDDDNDGLTDSAEATLGTNPLNPDTDSDGVDDGSDSCPLEDSTGFDANLDGCIDTPSGLSQIIETLPDDALSNETKNSLVSKVEKAENSIDRDADNAAINQLNAFINEVEAQRGNKISDEAADMLIAYALNIIAQIEAG